MTCREPNAYRPKTSPFTSKLSPFSAKANPFSEKQSVYERGASPVSPMCFDFVLKTFQDDEFFAFQDDSQFIFNLDNAML